MGDSMASGGVVDPARRHTERPAKLSPLYKLHARPIVRDEPADYPAPSPPPEMAIQRIADVRHHMEMCTETLRKLEVAGMDAVASGRQVAIGVSPVTIRTIAACLSELLKLEWAQPHCDSHHDLCKLLDCPQQPVLREAVHHAIDVLETTKFRFKSKELKRLRESLETLLGNSGDFSTNQTS